MSGEQAKRTSVHIGGRVSGQVNVGDGNSLYWQQIRAAGPATAADLAEVRAAIAELRAVVAIEQPETAGMAGSKLDELDEALTGEQVDLPTVEHVHGWFRRKLPKVAEGLYRVIAGPVVAKLVAAGGDQLVAEFSRRFSG
jgi:hypothetical protein